MGVTARREREREERRSAIIDAADEVFVRKGFAAATMDEIASAAEVSKGTLYLYFKSKDELYIAGIVRTISGLRDRYDEIAQGDGTGLEVLRALGQAYVEFAHTHPDHFRLGMSWMLTGIAIDRDAPSYGEYQRLIQGMFGITLQIIERGKADGSIRKDIDAHQVSMQMWGGTVGVLLLTLNREEIAHRVAVDIDFDAMAPSFIDLVLSGIKGNAPQ